MKTNQVFLLEEKSRRDKNDFLESLTDFNVSNDVFTEQISRLFTSSFSQNPRSIVHVKHENRQSWTPPPTEKHLFQRKTKFEAPLPPDTSMRVEKQQSRTVYQICIITPVRRLCSQIRKQTRTGTPQQVDGVLEITRRPRYVRLAGKQSQHSSTLWITVETSTFARKRSSLKVFFCSSSRSWNWWRR